MVDKMRDEIIIPDAPDEVRLRCGPVSISVRKQLNDGSAIDVLAYHDDFSEELVDIKGNTIHLKHPYMASSIPFALERGTGGWLTGEPAGDGWYMVTVLQQSLERRAAGWLYWAGTEWRDAPNGKHFDVFPVLVYQPLPEPFDG